MADDAPRTILIVDDSPEARDVYRLMLRDAGPPPYDFIEAATGAEALERARAGPFACILLDYRLPDLDGLAVLDALARSSGGDPLPVVMITAQGSEPVAVEAMKRGAQDYLVKGQLTALALRRAVENAVEKVALRRLVEGLERELERLRALAERLGGR